MQKSTRLGISGILTAVGSCIALVATLFMALFTWMEYFVPSHYGSVRVITEPFYVEIAIIIFEISAFVLGLLSALNTLKRRKFSLSILGVTFLLIAGLLFFTNLILNVLPHVETFGYYTGWSILQQYCGLPIIILASISIILLVSRKKEFNSKESNPSVTLEAILILCSIISASFAFFSIVPLEQSVGQFASNYALSTLIVSLYAFFFATLAGVLLLKKNNFYVLIALTVLSLLSALSLSFIFMFIYPWIGSFFKGLVTGSPIVILSAIALVLEFLTANKK
jgi:hypothetical protein